MAFKRVLMGLAIVVAMQPCGVQAITPIEAFRNLLGRGQSIEQHLSDARVSQVLVPRFDPLPILVIAGVIAGGVCVAGYALVRAGVTQVHLWRLQHILSLMPEDNFQDAGWKQIKAYSFSERIRAMMLLVKKEKPEQALRFACYAFHEHEKELLSYKKAYLWADAAMSIRAL